jgi:hypothetical protein
MWQVKGKRIDAQRFEPFEPLRVLNFFDGPRIFTFQDTDDALCLACWNDEGDSHSRFLVVPVTETIISNLEGGSLTVREALEQPRLWVVDLGFDGAVAEAWLVSPKDVPDDAQPQPGTMLHRDHDPRLSLRAI